MVDQAEAGRAKMIAILESESEQRAPLAEGGPCGNRSRTVDPAVDRHSRSVNLSVFEVETPPARKILKSGIVAAVTLGLSQLIGHWAVLVPTLGGVAGVIGHTVWCRRHGIDPLRATPRRKILRAAGMDVAGVVTGVPGATSNSQACPCGCGRDDSGRVSLEWVSRHDQHARSRRLHHRQDRR